MERKELDLVVQDQVSKLILQKIQHGAAMAISPNELRSMKAVSYVDEMSQRIIYQLRWQTLGRVTTYTHPKTWWDAFKIRFFPMWLRRKFPEQMTVIEAYQLFPDLPFPVNSTHNEYFGFPNQ